jgi:hypothetical protein
MGTQMHLLTPEDFGDTTEAEAGLLCNVAHREAGRLRSFEALASRSADLVALALDALKLCLSTAYLGTSFLLAVGHRRRSLWEEH